ncbi:MAG: TolC family protein [Syntrophomonas sp.]
MRKKSKTKVTVTFILSFCMFLLICTPVMAQNNTVSLTLEDAIKRGYSSSITLQKAEKSVETADKKFDNTMSNQTLSTITYSTAMNAQSDALSAQVASKTYEQTKDAVMYDITNKYWNIKKYEEHLKAAQLSYKKSLQDLGIARINAAVGLGTNATVLSAQSSNAQAKTALETAQNSLTNAYSLFNIAVGLNREDRPNLSEEIPDYKPINMNTLSIEISQAVTSNPSIWQTQQSALIAQNTANAILSTPGTTYYTYSQQLLSSEQAQLTVQNTERSVATTIESLFYQVGNLNQSYQQLLVSQEALAEAYRVKKLMYEVGVATQNDVLAAEVSLTNINMSINDSKYANNLLGIAFEKPWAMGS